MRFMVTCCTAIPDDLHVHPTGAFTVVTLHRVAAEVLGCPD
jgi:hypothetical protein